MVVKILSGVVGKSIHKNGMVLVLMFVLQARRGPCTLACV